MSDRIQRASSLVQKMFAVRSLFWPVLAALGMAAVFWIRTPGVIYGDAAEYMALARSITQGHFALVGEFSHVSAPTMLREPGYPALLAVIGSVAGFNRTPVFAVQALLLVLMVLIVARTMRRLDARWELPVAWGVALCPGLAVYVSQVGVELVTAFLVAVVAALAVRLWDARQRSLPLAVAFGLACGVTALTRATFELLAPAFLIAFVLTVRTRRAVLAGLVACVVAFACVTPWLIRNQMEFGEYQITVRTGIGLYTRALKAETSWGQLAASAASVLVGRATVAAVAPSADPIITQLWAQTWHDKNELLQNGKTYEQADRLLLQRAITRITASPSVFARYALWTGVDELRLFEMASPVTPLFQVELIARGHVDAQTLTKKDIAIVAVAHAVQIAWWALLVAGMFALVSARLWKHPSVWLTAYVVLLHAPFDLILRYAVPVLPWLIALAVAALWRPRRTADLAETTSTRSQDSRLIEAANVAYHEAEADLYDQSHPEILWCERKHWSTFGEAHLAKPERAPIRLVDIGAGTGFVGDALRPFLRADDVYVAVDLSRDMLERLRHKFAGAAFQVECVEASADRSPLPDGSADIVVMNSALHHVPDPMATLQEMARLAKPGAMIAIMHEPNIRFSGSALFRQVARVASVVAARLDRTSGPAAPRPDYAVVFAHVNQRLLAQGLLSAPLSQAEIQALVDVHSPTARGRYEAVGFDPGAWTRSGPFASWKVGSFETYNFLGKLDPSTFAWRRAAERVLSRCAPRSGSLFSIVVRKPL